MRVQKNREKKFKIGDLAVVKDGFLLSGFTVKILKNIMNGGQRGYQVELYGLSKYYALLIYPHLTGCDLDYLFFSSKSLKKR